jgi:hypothetical protein
MAAYAKNISTPSAMRLQRRHPRRRLPQQAHDECPSGGWFE